jgi:hypothetical protein
MAKELTIKAERVKALAERCTEYKTAMETLFPEVFNDGGEDITELITWKPYRFSGHGCWLHGSYKGNENLICMSGDEVFLNSDADSEFYKIEQSGIGHRGAFRVFKKNAGK